MDKKWKDFSLQKQGLLLIFVAFILFNVTTNLPILIRLIRGFFNILAPFIIGCTIAFFLARPVIKVDEALSKSKVRFIRKKSHVFATVSVFLIVISVATLIISYVSPIIVGNIVDFIGDLPLYYHNAIDWLRDLNEDHWLYGFIPSIPYYNEYVTSDILDAISPDADAINTGLIQLITAILTSILTNLVSLGTGILNFGLGLVIALYALLYRISVIALINRIATVVLKENTLVFVKSYIHRSNEVFYKFISAQFLDACILGTLSFILLTILRVEYAMTLALLLGICNMIPFFGSIFATLVTTVVTLLTGDWRQALIVLGALLVLQQIDANFISPKITGDVLGLNPLLIITSIFIGGSLMGIVGMFVAVPVAAMCKIFLDDYLTLREKKLGIQTKKE